MRIILSLLVLGVLFAASGCNANPISAYKKNRDTWERNPYAFDYESEKDPMTANPDDSESHVFPPTWNRR